MESIVLYPSKKKMLLMLAASLAFVFGGIWAIPTGGRILWLAVAFFGLCSVFSAVMLLPRAGSLKIEDDGFTFVSLFRTCTLRWQDVTAFYPGMVMTNAMVFFDYSSPVPPSRLGAASMAISGHQAALPDTYGLSAEKLAALLNESKQRFEQRRQQSK